MSENENITINPPTMAEVKNRDQGTLLLILFPTYGDSLMELHIQETILCRMFGILAETAGPILERYHSDLGRDLLALQRKLTDWWSEAEAGTVLDFTYLWGVDSCGTELVWLPNRDLLCRRFQFTARLWVTEENEVEFSLTRIEEEG